MGGEFWDYDRVTGEWGIRSDFNVNSSKQMASYIKGRGHPVPRNYKTKKDTTAKGEIERLSKKYPKDPLYGRVVRQRELGKLKSTYVEGFDKAIAGDGRVHPHFSFNPSTGRLACERPNLQNIPKRGEFAKEYRLQFVPPSGCVLVEFDFRAIEAVLVGWLARDAGYIRAAKLGVHAILASRVLAGQGKLDEFINMGWDDTTIKGVVDHIKHNFSGEYAKNKAGVYLSAYGGTPFRMHSDYPSSFPTLKDAEEWQKFYFGTLGRKVREWQNNLLVEAHHKHYLQTPFGFRRYFYDIFYYDMKKGASVRGTDAKEALAFPAQSMARCVTTSAMQRLPNREGLMVMIHDALLFALPDDSTLGERMEEIRHTMEAPIPELDGLIIEVEGQVGESWGVMEEVE